MMLLLLFSLWFWPDQYVGDLTEKHEFHLSKCDINYNQGEGALQIALSIFIDDLEATLAANGKTDLHICSEQEAPLAESHILEYIQQHLQITVDGQSVDLNWVGKEISEDLAAVWSYLEVTDIHPKKSIEISNDILMSAFDDQQNVVKLVLDRDRQSFFLFNKKEFSGRLDL